MILINDFSLAFCHFLVLIQGKTHVLSRPSALSNQRKSRKNNASTLQAYAHPAIFSGIRAWIFTF
jgi:hypothetical protein